MEENTFVRKTSLTDRRRQLAKLFLSIFDRIRLKIVYQKTLRFICFIFLVACLSSKGQQSPTPFLSFDFNGAFNEDNNKLITKPVGVSLVKDRFGNENRALYLHGNPESYLNLGTSSLLKPKKGSFSLWVNLERIVYAGKGYESNPIMGTKNSPSHDFYDAYQLFYDWRSKRFMVFGSEDSTGVRQAGVNALDTTLFNKWYHIVFTYDNNSMGLYIDGKLQALSEKKFETQFFAPDSVVVGNGADTKNYRWMRGMVDDIKIYDRVLTPEEVKTLYEEPNPNRTRNFITKLLKYGSIIFAFVLTIVFVIWRYRRILRTQKEKLELNNRIAELEMQVVKTQMDPHFISNCLAAIQELIYDGNIDKAGQYIAKFSLFMRQVLNYSDRTFISLEDELELVKLNIELEQLRFKDSFEFRMKVAEGVDVFEVTVPSLITQPIIENAIWHGLLPLKDKRKPVLSLFVYQKDESLYIDIEDNGVGRDPSLIQKRNSKGTQLINDRLESLRRLSGSKNYKMEILDLVDEVGKNQGTKVIIQIDNKSD